MPKPVVGPEYLKLPRNVGTWIVEPLLPMGGSLNIFGKPKAGKSLAALQMASCIGDATKDEFLGFPIGQHGRVLYVQLDTSREIWALDMENALSEGYSFDNVWIVDKEIAPRPFDARTNGSEYILDCVKEYNPIVVFIDTIRKCHDGDENDSGEMKVVMEKLQLACKGAAMVIISHARKGNPDFEELMSENRGSNFVAGEVDCVLKVTKKRFTYEGRTVDERRLDLTRTPKGFWSLNTHEIQQKLFSLLAKPENKTASTNALAETLAQECGISKESARNRIRYARGEK